MISGEDTAERYTKFLLPCRSLISSGEKGRKNAFYEIHYDCLNMLIVYMKIDFLNFPKPQKMLF